MSAATIRGSVCIAGVGETDYFKRGQAPDAEKMAVVVQEFAGLHSGVNPTSGDLSVGIEGFRLRAVDVDAAHVAEVEHAGLHPAFRQGEAESRGIGLRCHGGVLSRRAGTAAP